MAASVPHIPDDLSESDDMTTEAAIELFIGRTRRTRTGSRHTERAYRGDLRHFETFLTRRRLDLWTVTRAEANRYLGELAAKTQPRTVKRRVSCIRSLYRFLRSIEAIEVNPFDALDLPSHDLRSETHKVLTPQQTLALVDLLAADVAHWRDRYHSARLGIDRTRAFRRYFVATRRRAMVLFALLGGLRSAEILTLPVSAFTSLPEGFTLTFTGKGDKRRMVPVSEDLTPVLFDWLSVRREVPTTASTVFVTLAGQPVGKTQIGRDVQALGERLGTAFTLGPHALRRTFATQMLGATGNLRGVGELVGHKSVATTEIYTHVDQAGLRKLLDDARTAGGAIPTALPPAAGGVAQ